MDAPGSLPTAAPEGGTTMGYAGCDRCNSRIKEKRYKCLACPDFDYCSACYSDATIIHPGHEFMALTSPSTPQEVQNHDEPESQVHEDIACPVTPPRTHRLCRSCEPITKPLPTIHFLLDDARLKSQGRNPPREISMLWPVRISSLVEATQRGCAFCAFIMDRFFFSGSTLFYGYSPTTPWYTQPLNFNDQRQRAVAYCMNMLTKCGNDKIMFYVTPSCTRVGKVLPDFDRLIIGVDRERNDVKMLKEANVFALVGQLEIEVDVYAAIGLCPTIHNCSIH